MSHYLHECTKVENEKIMKNILANNNIFFLIAYQEGDGTMIFYYKWSEMVSDKTKCYYGYKVFVPTIKDMTQSVNTWTVAFNAKTGIIIFKQYVLVIRTLATIVIFIIFVILVTKHE